jgi:hypothetical protein
MQVCTSPVALCSILNVVNTPHNLFNFLLGSPAAASVSQSHSSSNLLAVRSPYLRLSPPRQDQPKSLWIVVHILPVCQCHLLFVMVRRVDSPPKFSTFPSPSATSVRVRQGAGGPGTEAGLPRAGVVVAVPSVEGVDVSVVSPVGALAGTEAGPAPLGVVDVVSPVGALAGTEAGPAPLGVVSVVSPVGALAGTEAGPAPLGVVVEVRRPAGSAEGLRVGLPRMTEGLRVGLPRMTEGLRVGLPRMTEGLRVGLPRMEEGLREALPRMTEGLREALPRMTVEGMIISLVSRTLKGASPPRRPTQVRTPVTFWSTR